MLTSRTFPSLVDHTLLKPEATERQIAELCQQAASIACYSVCVNGIWVALAKSVLSNSDVKVCAVVGFPLGSMSIAAKSFEAKCAIQDGADEVDMVMSIGHLKNNQDQLAIADIRSVRASIGDDHVLKVILETALLTDDEIRRACIAVQEGKGSFVKTSTGFNSAGGATVHSVHLMKEMVGSTLGIKASGGIRTLEDAEAMVAAGATRLGLSGTVTILDELRAREVNLVPIL